MQYAKKVDKNQKEIVAALRAFGFSVESLHTICKGIPDLLAGRDGYNYLVEVKDDKNTLTEPQQIFHANWRGRIWIIRTVSDAQSMYNYHINYIRKIGELNGIR